MDNMLYFFAAGPGSVPKVSAGQLFLAIIFTPLDFVMSLLHNKQSETVAI